MLSNMPVDRSTEYTNTRQDGWSVSLTSSQPAIRVVNVGKMYRIYDKPVDRLKAMLLWRFGRSYGHEFWAIRDVSFGVEKGESVGIIGRNGSGKSTLLQMIAQTLAPTEGRIEVYGRVAALLELGSGFNPEFTGRENVYLNGAILGMSHENIDALFDEIAAFADIGEFIDQPVKLYSSGMAVRLAFAVQAIVPKDILIVDEALAVGDEAFQRKCMRRLEQFRNEGGTVLLVTHSSDTIVRHCDRCVFLHAGRQILIGSSKPVTDLYQHFALETPVRQQELLQQLVQLQHLPIEEVLGLVSQQAYRRTSINAPMVMSGQNEREVEEVTLLDQDLPQTTELVYGTGQAEIFAAAMYDTYHRRINVLVTGEQYIWQTRIRFKEEAWNLNFGMMLRSLEGLMVTGINSEWEGLSFPQHVQANEVATAQFRFTANIAPGVYFVESGIIGDTAASSGSGNFLHRRVDICAIKVTAPLSKQIYGIAYIEPEILVHFASQL